MRIVKIAKPREYFDHVVNLDVNDFIADPTDLRRAYHACISLLSLRDWIWREHKNKPWSYQQLPQGLIGNEIGHFHNSIQRIYSNFNIIYDIANASKHMILERGKTNMYGNANVEIMSITNASGGAQIGASMFNTSMLGDAGEVTTSDHIQVKIDANYFDVLTCVVSMRAIWIVLLQENSW